jgi:hypothetical protein
MFPREQISLASLSIPRSTQLILSILATLIKSLLIALDGVAEPPLDAQSCFRS